MTHWSAGRHCNHEPNHPGPYILIYLYNYIHVELFQHSIHLKISTEDVRAVVAQGPPFLHLRTGGHIARGHSPPALQEAAELAVPGHGSRVGLLLYCPQRGPKVHRFRGKTDSFHPSQAALSAQIHHNKTGMLISSWKKIHKRGTHQNERGRDISKGQIKINVTGSPPLPRALQTAPREGKGGGSADAELGDAPSARCQPGH